MHTTNLLTTTPSQLLLLVLLLVPNGQRRMDESTGLIDLWMREAKNINQRHSTSGPDIPCSCSVKV